MHVITSSPLVEVIRSGVDRPQCQGSTGRTLYACLKHIRLAHCQRGIELVVHLPVPDIGLWLRGSHLQCMIDALGLLNFLCQSVFAYKLPYLLACHNSRWVVAVPVSLAVEGVKHHLYTAFPGLPCSARALGIWFVLRPRGDSSCRSLAVIMRSPCRHSCLHIVIGNNVVGISVSMYKRYWARTAHWVAPHQIATDRSEGCKLLVHIVGAEVCHHTTHRES